MGGLAVEKMPAARGAFSFLREGLKYETFWNSQSNSKYTLVLLYPAALWYTRWTTDSSYKYRVYMSEKGIEPDTSANLFSGWSNGKEFYGSAMTTVGEFKDQVYSPYGKTPAYVRVGCHGRMMEDSDNLALAVRSFCKGDPMLVFWEDEAAKAGF